MSYSATIFNVMLASPSDVAKERGYAREVIHEWNAMHGESRQMALMPIGWETHAHPSMDDGPQEVLNQQILKQADLLVAIFWTKIGTATAAAVSGSVEEIEKHVKAGKPAMVYFSLAPVALASVNDDQLKALQKFKEELKSRSLYADYESAENFKEMFRWQLGKKLNDADYFKAVTVTPPQTSAAITAVLSTARSAAPKLSEEAQTLLTEAALDSRGHILYRRFIGGVHLQTNGKQLIQDRYPRSPSAMGGRAEGVNYT